MTDQPRDLAADPNASAPACISDERLAELVDIYLRDMEHAKIWVGEESLEKDVHAALSELAALRRPVGQSDEIQAIKARLAMVFNGEYVFEHDDAMAAMDKLVAALDQAQREIQQAAWRNAHALVTAERDEALWKVERLEKDRTGWINANSPGGWIDDLRVRIERLEGALRMALLVLGDGRGLTAEQQAQVDLALAAADGQQP